MLDFWCWSQTAEVGEEKKIFDARSKNKHMAKNTTGRNDKNQRDPWRKRDPSRRDAPTTPTIPTLGHGIPAGKEWGRGALSCAGFEKLSSVVGCFVSF